MKTIIQAAVLVILAAGVAWAQDEDINGSLNVTGTTTLQGDLWVGGAVQPFPSHR